MRNFANLPAFLKLSIVKARIDDTLTWIFMRRDINQDICYMRGQNLLMLVDNSGANKNKKFIGLFGL
jgi:hypothetical protein